MEVNFTFKKENIFRDLQNILRDNELYEKTYLNSRFLSMINYQSDLPFLHYGFQNAPNDSIKIKNYTTVVASDMKGEVLGILVFENYQKPERTKYFVSNGKRIKYIMNGFLCLYVKPKHRNQGIAQNMVRVFNEQYIFEDDTIQLISGVQGTSKILKEICTSFVYVKSAYNTHLWKETARSYFRYYPNKQIVDITYV